MNAMRCRRPRHVRREAGSVLLVAVIFLMILTMIVLTMVVDSTFEERMAANDRNRQVALQAADAVLRDAESTLFTSAPFDPFDPSRFTADCANGLCSALALNTEARWKSSTTWTAAATRTFADPASQLSTLSSQPQYYVELISAPYRANAAVARCEPGVATITARGQGRDRADVYIQSTYRWQPADC